MPRRLACPAIPHEELVAAPRKEISISRRMHRHAFSAALVIALTSASTRAGSFDARGVFTFDSKAIHTEGFTSPPAQMGLEILAAPDALEGGTYASITTQQSSITISVAVLPNNASYRAQMFVRKGRIVADIDVGYGDDGGSPSFNARMYPTGVITSDGWYEVASNTFSIEGARKPKVWLSLQASDTDVDAFELVAAGTFKALTPCSVPRDSACGAGEVCATRWCRNGDAFVPPLPAPDHRAGVLDYLAGRLRIFFGGRLTRLNRLPVALVTLDAARAAPTAWDFWNGVATAIHQLRDWHTTLNGPVGFSGRGAFPICFVEGDADLSHQFAAKNPKYADVLVSHVGPTANGGLKPGDRIVAINGVHPIEFVESLEDVDWGIWRADDPEAHAESVERLSSIVRRWAKTITVIRCNPQSATCSAPETIDVTALPADASNIVYPYCDHRPLYHLGQSGPNPITHSSYYGPFYGPVQESLQGENIWGSVWDSVYLASLQQNPYQPMIEAFRDNANGVILDHRLGNGGTVLAATYLTSLFRSPDHIAVWPGFNTTVGMYDDFSTQDGLDLWTMFKDTGLAYDVGSNTPKTTNMPTAVLLARDGSASDWFPFGMQGLPNVRIFGRRTSGAFSSYYQLDYYGGFSWRMASGDLVRPNGATHLGEGVLPDEDIVPTQSDLLAGKDTVFLRALQWIRTCQGCR